MFTLWLIFGAVILGFLAGLRLRLLIFIGSVAIGTMAIAGGVYLFQFQDYSYRYLPISLSNFEDTSVMIVALWVLLQFGYLLGVLVKEPRATAFVEARKAAEDSSTGTQVQHPDRGSAIAGDAFDNITTQRVAEKGAGEAPVVTWHQVRRRRDTMPKSRPRKILASRIP